jgi:catechol 2,3-dioxygenase-like lactoylglutathione lyase family enzyme
MKRFHVHLAVADVERSVRFYSALFAAEPSVVKPDYAKWMLEDPRVNFAISRRGGPLGVQHLGIQVEDETELAEVFGRLTRAESPVLEQKGTRCCYAQGDKQWIADPEGVAWETFLTRGSETVYGESGAVAQLEELGRAGAAICCEPVLAAPAPASPRCGCGTSAAEAAP